MNSPSIPKFAQGAVVRGPTLGVIGEGEEDEWVIPDSKMRKMAGARKESAINQTIVVVDKRVNLKPGDVEFIIADSMNRGGMVGKMTQKLINRHR